MSPRIFNVCVKPDLPSGEEVFKKTTVEAINCFFPALFLRRNNFFSCADEGPDRFSGVELSPAIRPAPLTFSVSAPRGCKIHLEASHFIRLLQEDEQSCVQCVKELKTTMCVYRSKSHHHHHLILLSSLENRCCASFNVQPLQTILFSAAVVL